MSPYFHDLLMLLSPFIIGGIVLTIYYAIQELRGKA